MNLLTTKEVASQLRISRTAVYALCESGQLQHYRVGTGKKNRFRVSEEQLAAYLSKIEVTQPATIAMTDARQKPVKQLAGYRRLRAAGWNG